jgi:Uma2 family endonuclease
MSTLVLDPPDTGVRRWPITVESVECMLRAGILNEDDPIELIEGELFEMPPAGDWHNAGVNALTRRFSALAPDSPLVQAQSGIRISPTSSPEPDIALLTFRADFYRAGGAGPGDVLLVVEVSDSTVKFDRDVKLPLYARAGIPEVWIVTREPAAIEVYRSPREGIYTERLTCLRGDSVSPLSLPDVRIAVTDVTG